MLATLKRLLFSSTFFFAELNQGDEVYIGDSLYTTVSEISRRVLVDNLSVSVQATVTEPIVLVRKQVDMVPDPIVLQAVVTDPVVDIRHAIEVVPQSASVSVTVNDPVLGLGHTVVPQPAVVTSTVTDPDTQIGDSIPATVVPQPAIVSATIKDVSIRTTIAPDPASHNFVVNVPQVTAPKSDTIFTMNFLSVENGSVERTAEGDFELV